MLRGCPMLFTRALLELAASGQRTHAPTLARANCGSPSSQPNAAKPPASAAAAQSCVSVARPPKPAANASAYGAARTTPAHPANELHDHLGGCHGAHFPAQHGKIDHAAPLRVRSPMELRHRATGRPHHPLMPSLPEGRTDLAEPAERLLQRTRDTEQIAHLFTRSGWPR